MTSKESCAKVLFIKPPDRFLDKEFVYPQLGPHYLQSFLDQQGIASDMLVLYEPDTVRKERETGLEEITLDQLRMIHLSAGIVRDEPFDHHLFDNYDIAGISSMTPQAPDSYRLSELLNAKHPRITTVIGGSHARYYHDAVLALPEKIAFDFVVPHDGWGPMLQIACGEIRKGSQSIPLSEKLSKLTDFPAPTRPLDLLKRYEFGLGGIPAYHTITALGCPFTCKFCESATEDVRKFSDSMIRHDLETMAEAHRTLGHSEYGLMIFDDVGLMNPNQVKRLSEMIKDAGYRSWRAFTHAYLVVQYKERLLGPFKETGGQRIGMGLETGSQRSLDLINKRNGQPQKVSEHYESVRIANDLGIAVDAFTMIYPWENEQDLHDTTEMLRAIATNEVKGTDQQGRPLRNYVDATIMSPYQGTPFRDLILQGKIPGVKLNPEIDPGMMFYKGRKGGSGWPYRETVLPRERYEQEQALRNALRPSYR